MLELQCSYKLRGNMAKRADLKPSLLNVQRLSGIRGNGESVLQQVRYYHSNLGCWGGMAIMQPGCSCHELCWT